MNAIIYKRFFKTTGLLSLLVAGSCFLWQCTDIFEPNLGKDKFSVSLSAPGDSVRTEIQNQVFTWEKIKGATKYQFQLAYPSFDKPEIILVDSTTAGTSYAYSFNFSGAYQWRVKAINSSSETDFKTRTLFVTKVMSLSKQTLFVYEPVDSFCTNEHAVTLSWKKILVANRYVFSLQQNNEKGKFIVGQYVTNDLSLKLPMAGFELTEGTYYWTLTAENDTSSSAPAGRSFIIDRTSPPAPTLMYPKRDSVLIDTTSVDIVFSWKRLATDVIFDSIYILDSNKKVILFKTRSTSMQYTYPSPMTGQRHYWMVKSFDKAGNASVGSEVRKYSFKKPTTVNPVDTTKKDTVKVIVAQVDTAKIPIDTK